ncbi:phosphoribosylanthranilate isomerase [Lachnospiraceae bacterium XBB2008]|nr:phosphoribosylanthranilate isomerase [Lachnospiraceae bacterium XBB2008]
MFIKICGITRPGEIEYLNEYKPDYAGFVIYEPSKRYVTPDQASDLASMLDPEIKRVAVLVSPDAELIKKVEESGFADILQIHRELTEEALRAATLPVWAAVNLSDLTGYEEAIKRIDELPGKLPEKITAIVADAPEFGSGKTFNWKSCDIRKSKRTLKAGTNSPPARLFCLAGGLNAANVAEGIRIFEPDIVDVSSGVEGEQGKDPVKIRDFIQTVRKEENI